MKWFTDKAYEFAAHAILVWVMVIMFIVALLSMNFAIAAIGTGYQGIAYLIGTFAATASSAMAIWILDMIHPKLGRRVGLIAIRRGIAVAGSIAAFYACYPKLRSEDGLSFDQSLFAYCSPAIAILIGLIYADVSRLLITRPRLETAADR